MDVGRGQFGNIEDDINAKITKSGDVDGLGLEVVYGAIDGGGVGGVFGCGDMEHSGAVEDGMGAGENWRENWGLRLGMD